MGIDLLIGMRLINEMCGVIITGTGTLLGSKSSVCVAIIVNEKDFNAEFDRITKVWTAVWKYANNQATSYLRIIYQ